MRTVWLLLLIAGCSRTGQENFGIAGTRPAPPIDVQNLARPAEVVRALAMPGAELDRYLGARHFEATSSIKIEPAGQPVQQLDETYRLDSDGRGALHLLHDNAHAQGMEAVLVGGELYVRPRYGKFIHRKPEGDEVERLRALVEGVAGDYVTMLERWLSVSEAGRTEVSGRPAVRLKLTAAPTAASAPAEVEKGKKWRDTVQVRYIDGELTLDAKSGAPLAARLAASYSFVRPGSSSPVAITLSYKQTSGPAAPIAAPDDAVPMPKRPRPLLDRQTLLDGLVRSKEGTR
jgi:hypothetical protein